MNTDILIGIITGTTALVLMLVLLVVSLVRIERIASKGYGTGRESLKGIKRVK